MDAREDLSTGDVVAGAAASWLTLWCSLVLVLTSNGPTISELSDVLVWAAISMIYATPVWFVVMIFVGLPVAYWIERRTPVDSTPVRRFAPYAIAGAAIGGVLYLLHPLALPFSVACSLAGRLGAGWWRSRQRRRASDGAAVNLA